MPWLLIFLGGFLVGTVTAVGVGVAAAAKPKGKEPRLLSADRLKDVEVRVDVDKDPTLKALTETLTDEKRDALFSYLKRGYESAFAQALVFARDEDQKLIQSLQARVENIHRELATKLQVITKLDASLQSSAVTAESIKTTLAAAQRKAELVSGRMRWIRLEASLVGFFAAVLSALLALTGVSLRPEALRAGTLALLAFFVFHWVLVFLLGRDSERPSYS